MLNHPQTQERNKKLAAEAAKKRAKLLAQLPDQFTAKDAREAWAMTISQANHQLQQMQKHREVEVVSGYTKPATYAKRGTSNAPQ